MASDWAAKIISIKTQTELIQVTWELAEKGQAAQVKEAACPAVRSLQTYLQ